MIWLAEKIIFGCFLSSNFSFERYLAGEHLEGAKSRASATHNAKTKYVRRISPQKKFLKNAYGSFYSSLCRILFHGHVQTQRKTHIEATPHRSNITTQQNECHASSFIYRRNCNWACRNSIRVRFQAVGACELLAVYGNGTRLFVFGLLRCAFSAQSAWNVCGRKRNEIRDLKRRTWSALANACHRSSSLRPHCPVANLFDYSGCVHVYSQARRYWRQRIAPHL